jgi:hypothetical protein
VRTAAKREMPLCLSGEIQRVWIREARWLAVAAGDIEDNPFAGAYCLSADVNVFLGHPHDEALHDAQVTQQFVHGRGHDLRVVGVAHARQ